MIGTSTKDVEHAAESLRTITSRDPAHIRKRVLELVRLQSEADFAIYMSIVEIDGQLHYSEIVGDGDVTRAKRLNKLLSGRAVLPNQVLDYRRPLDRDLNTLTTLQARFGGLPPEKVEAFRQVYVPLGF